MAYQSTDENQKRNSVGWNIAKTVVDYGGLALVTLGAVAFGDYEHRIFTKEAFHHLFTLGVLAGAAAPAVYSLLDKLQSTLTSTREYQATDHERFFPPAMQFCRNLFIGLSIGLGVRAYEIDPSTARYIESVVTGLIGVGGEGLNIWSKKRVQTIRTGLESKLDAA